MILFTVLLLIGGLLITFMVLTVSVIGAGACIIFGDVIVCIAIIFAIIKHLIKKRKK